MSDVLPDDAVGAFVGPPALLAVGAVHGPLAGCTLGVKDVIDVAGAVTGAGNPTFAAGRTAAAAHATSVAALVAAGATVVGKTITDELAYSLSGTNVHHGTPINAAAPDRVPGGSSAGSAAAVAAGLCDLGLGTDTGGSIRVPASYCGIVGWRPTHGAVDATGVVPLARSFDTVGLLARDLDVLRRAAEVLLPPMDDGPVAVGEAVWVSELLDLVDDGARASLATVLGASTIDLGIDLVAAADAFRVLQGMEAWAEHGAWITAAKPIMGAGIAERFAVASRITADEVGPAQAVRDEVRRVVAEATADGRVLVGPAAAGPAPRAVDAGASRARTLQLTCLAGLAGAPVVVLPLARAAGLPLGVAFLGAPGADRALLAHAGTAG